MKRRRPAMSLVELLIVMAIIGILVSLLLPAVQFARESARRTVCQNHVRQLALAWHHHEHTQRHLPTGGWGWDWVGDPDLGYGRHQPGGWTYAVLDFVEQSPLRAIGTGQPGPLKKIELARLVGHPISEFYCPSLRRAALYPITVQPVNAATVIWGAKIDYVACAGDGPDEWNGGHADAPAVEFSGVVGVKSTTTLAEIRDGLSNTFLLGEKYLHPDRVNTGTDGADNENLYVGLDNDTCRTTQFPPQTGRSSFPHATFGSYHPAGFNIAMCDGSIRRVAYEIDLLLFRILGNRYDGEIASAD